MAQYRRKNIKDNAIGSDQIALDNNKSLKAQKANKSGYVDILKLNENDSVEFLVTPTLPAGNATQPNQIIKLSQLETEKQLLVTADTNLQNQIDALELDSQELRSDLTALSSQSSGAQSSLSSRLDALELDPVSKSYVDSADQSLDSKITTEKNRVDAILSASEADKDTFAEIVSLINSVDTENDSTFASYVISNNIAVADLDSRLDTAESNINSLELDLSQEATTRASADNSLQANIDALDVYTQEVRVDLDSLDVYAQEIRSDVDGLEAVGSAIQSSLTQEIADRQAADTAIGLEIDAVESGLAQEILDRQAADTAIGLEIDTVESALAQEIVDRQAADNSLDLSKANKNLNNLVTTEIPSNVNLVFLNNTTSSITETSIQTKHRAVAPPNYSTENSPSGSIKVQSGHVAGDMSSGGARLWTGYNFSSTRATPTTVATGTVSLLTGGISTGTGQTGNLFASTGTVFNASSQGNSGAAYIGTGSVQGTGSTGKIEIITGDASNGSSGNIELKTGLGTNGTRGKALFNVREIDAGNVIITNMANGSSSNDAINKGQLDSAILIEETARVNEDLTFLKLDGSRNMTGGLTFANPSHVGTARLFEDDDTLKLSYNDTAGIYGGGLFETELYSGQINVQWSGSNTTRILGGFIDLVQYGTINTPNLPTQPCHVTVKKYVDDKDLVLDGKISTEKNRIDAILSASQADKDSFAEIVTLINSIDTENDTAFAGYVLSNNAALAQEVSDRQAGDTSTLESAKDYTDTEISTLDQELTLALNQEVTNRNTAVTAEASAREAADQNLQSQITQEVTNRESADSSLQDQIDDLDVFTISLQGEIDDINAFALSTQSDVDDLDLGLVQVQSSIVAETTRAQAAESLLDSRLDTVEPKVSTLETEMNAVETSIASVQASISNEESARITADQSLSNAISQETSNRQNAISLESSARELADQNLQSQITTEKNRIDSILLASDADKDSFSEIVQLINTVDTENDQAFAGYVLSNNAAVALKAEKTYVDSQDESKLLEAKTYTDAQIAAIPAVDLSGYYTKSEIDTKESALDSRIDTLEAFGYEQLVYVSKNGSDSNTGKQHSPFLTITAAMNAISDASPTKRYAIKVAAGNYSEAIALKANVFIVGEGQKESVRITGAVSMGSSFTANSSFDNRSGFGNLTLLSAANFDWNTVQSAAGKLYFSEVVFGSTVNMNGYNNAIAQSQFNSCVIFGALTISGINVAVFTNNVCYGNINLNQHPNGGMATILVATGGYCQGTITQTATVNDFNRRSASFLRHFNSEQLVLNGPSVYADVDLVSQGKQLPTISNGANLIALNPTINHDLTSQRIVPKATNSHNMGDWGAQWMFNFGYVHASSGTDLYLTSVDSSYDSAGSSTGYSINIEADGYGLKPNVNGGDVKIVTATPSGTGTRGKVQLNGSEIDVTSKKITNLADGTISTDAINKGQLDSVQNGLQSQITTEKGRVDAILLAADADKDSFAEIVQLINSVDTTNDQAFGSYVLSNDAAVALKADKTYTDAQDEAKLLEAKNYTDAQIAAIPPVDLSAYETIANVDSKDASTLVSANSYTDSSIAAIPPVDLSGYYTKTEVDSFITTTGSEVTDLEAYSIDIRSDLDALDVYTQEIRSDLDQSISDIESDISNEASARQAADSNLQTSINNEISARELANTSLQSEINAVELSLSNETSRAIAAETVLDNKIETEKARIDSILNASQADKDSFAEIVTLINSIDTTNDQAFAGYVASNNQVVADLDSRLDTLEPKVSALEGEMDAVELSIANEVTRAQSAEELLDSRLNTVESKVTTLESEMNAVEGSIFSLEGTVQGNFDLQQSDIDGVRSDLDFASSSISVLESKMDTAQADLISLDGRLDAVEPKVSALELEMDAAQSDINLLQTQLTQEATTRENADSSLQSNIDALDVYAQDIRNDLDDLTTSSSGIQSSLTQEIANRIASDTETLNSANTYTDSKVATETSARQTADSQLQSDIDAEEARAIAAESLLASRSLSNLTATAIPAGVNLESLNTNTSFTTGFQIKTKDQTTSNSGSVRMTSGDSAGAFSSGGARVWVGKNLTAQKATPEIAATGVISLLGGDVTGIGSSSNVYLSTGHIVGATSQGNSGPTLLNTGSNDGTGNTGNIGFNTGNATNGNSGDVNITTGTASGIRGKLFVDVREIDVNNKKITNLANAESSNDAVNKAQLDAEQSRATSAESLLQSQISQEINDRTSANQSLQSQIDNVLSNVNPDALDSLTEIVAAFEAADSSLEGTISALANNSTANIQAEESRAMLAEANLQSQITQEITDRAAADLVLQNSISSEATRATNAETALSQSIADEVARAISAEEVLQDNIDTLDVYSQEIRSDLDDLNIFTFDIRSELDQEVIDRTTADSALSSQITALEQSSLAADTNLSNLIAAETAARQAAIADLLSNTDPAALDSLSEVVSAFQAADANLNNAISSLGTGASSALASEITRAQAAEGDLQSQITAEISRATSAEGLNASNLVAEIADREAADLAEQTARVAADNNLQSQINSIISNTDPAVIDSLVEVVAAFEAADSNINNAITSLANSASSALASETTRAQNAEENLQDQIDSLSSNVSTNVSSLDGRIDALEADPVTKTYVDGSVTTLQGQINFITANTDPAMLDSLTEVVTAFQQADSDLQNAISILTFGVSNQITVEQTARINADNALNTRVTALEAKTFAKKTITISGNYLSVDLDHNANVNSIVGFKNRIPFHLGHDFTTSVVSGKTRLTWIGDFASAGSQALVDGDKIFLTYYY